MKRNISPLFQSHLDFAHRFWERILKKDDIAIDATCGGGYDTAFLSTLSNHVIGLDIQEEAIEKTTHRLSQDQKNNVRLLRQSHQNFPDWIQEESVTLIVYNLGYLPGGEKTITTQSPITLESVKNAMRLLKKGGVISITAYPGHAEGKLEQDALSEYFSTLSPKEWQVSHHLWINRRLSPSLFLVQNNCDHDKVN
ncbi:MAG: class I SAM-dependent methyltransferase [Waddliaceae bacterium]